jgi:hypothetical protein
MTKIWPKSELFRLMERFHADKERGISIKLFCELCGIGTQTFKDVFLYKKAPLSEMVQIRVSKGYNEWLRGRVRIMQNRDQTRFVDYRREAKPPLMPSTKLELTPQGIKVRVGMVNRHDYQQPDLDEALRG